MAYQACIMNLRWIIWWWTKGLPFITVPGEGVEMIAKMVLRTIYTCFLFSQKLNNASEKKCYPFKVNLVNEVSDGN